MKIHYLVCGTMKPHGAKQFVPALEQVINLCVLVETGSGLVLVDTGYGTADMVDPGRLGRTNLLLNALADPAAPAAVQISNLGFSPSDVEAIICTHLDRDHAGGLADFPQATVHVLEAERNAALKPLSRKERDRYRECHFAHGPRWAVHGPTGGERWFGLECIRDEAGLTPGIVLVPLPGHTRGHCGVAVEADGGWIFHCGDAYYVPGELRGTSHTPIGVRAFRRIAHFDRMEAAAQIEKINKAVSSGNGRVTVICSHDPGGLALV